MPKKQLTQELGRSGVEIWSGAYSRPSLSSEILSDDYLSDWTCDAVDRMLRGDGQVAAIWRAITLLLQGAEWYMVPASNAVEDHEIAAFVESNLWPLWPDFLRQALLHLPYGYMLFEPVYEVREGQLWWKKLAPRMPWTVQKWKIRDGMLAEVEQFAQDPETEKYSTWTIPARKIIRFTHDQQGLNFEGISVLRAAYKHYKVKDALYKIAAISAERWGVGTPIGALPPQISDKESKDAFKEILKNLRSNEVGHIMLPPGSDIDSCLKILTPEGGHPMLEHILAMIRHHDVLIGRSVLAEFLSLGETNFGSRSVSKDQLELFFASLESIAEYVAHVTTHGNEGENRGIADLVAMNYGEDAAVPRLTWGKLRKQDTASIANALAQLVQVGAITPTVDLDRWARDLIGAPETPDEEVEPASRLKARVRAGETHQMTRCDHGEQKKGLTAGLGDAPTKLQGTGGFWRELYPWEEHVRFAEYRWTHEDLEDEFVREWEDVLEDQADAIRSELGSRVTPDELDRVRSLAIPTGALVGALYLVLRKAYLHGRQAVGQELTGRWLRGERIAAQADAVLRAQAQAASVALAARVKRAVENAVLPQFAQGQVEVDVDTVIRAVRDLSTKEARLESYSGVRTAWGLGRTEAGHRVSRMVKRGFYSAVLDDNVCGSCEDRDGDPVEPGEHATPNPACEGGARCRCITIWELVERSEADLESAWDEEYGED